MLKKGSLLFTALVLTLSSQAQNLPGGALSKEKAAEVTRILNQQRDTRLKNELRSEWDAKLLTAETLNEEGQPEKFSMKFWDTIYGPKEVPAGGRSMYISMHGGGGAPPEVNDQQWSNQKYLYNLQEGLYFVPRSPTDSWNMWHQGYMDIFLRKAIAAAVLFEGVNPDRVYVMGYSAGGDGTYQMGPRMADHWAAAAMMAGHPGDACPDVLLNLPFALFMGGLDDAYDRSHLTRQWETRLDLLQIAEGKGYAHESHIYEDLGHWMMRKDTAAISWMAQFDRVCYPEKVVWVQDDILRDNFYWIGVPEMLRKQGDKTVARIEGQTVYVEQMDPAVIYLGLNDRMLDLDKPVAVIYNGIPLKSAKLKRKAATLQQSLDPSPYSIQEPYPVILQVEKNPLVKGGATVTER